MDALHLGIITLLRSALNGEALTLPEGFSWEEASGILRYHHLTGMAVQGASLCGVSRRHPAFVKLTAAFCEELRESREQMQLLQRIYALFDANGIAYLPVKGAVIKTLYPRPEYRLMGDADILIRPEQYPQIRLLLPSLGLREDGETDYELNWTCPGLDLELHKRLIATHNKDYHAYYGDGWPDFCEKGPGSSWHLKHEEHFIYLLVHFAKHYREGSVSAKNICDFWVCRKAWGQMDEDYIAQRLRKLKLLAFYENIQDVLNAWFTGAAFTDAAKLITRVAFRGGIYSHAQSELVSSVIKLNQEESSLAGSKLRWFFRRLFPPVQIMECSYPVLKKAPVLLPFFWVLRLVRLLTRDPQRVARGLANTQEVSHVSSESLAYYEDQLKAVGLGFNFRP